MSILSVDNISPIGSGTSVTVNSAATLVLTNANSTGVITATSFVGNLTGNVTGTSLDISGDIDVDGHTELDNINISGVSTHVGLSQFQNTINLTHASAGQNYIYFNEDLQFAKNGTGTRLKIDSSGRLGVGIASPTKLLDIATSTSADGIRIKSTGNTYNELSFDANRTSANTHIGRIISYWNGTAVSYISMDAGSDTTNKDDGMIRFWTANGSGNYERLRITSDGNIGINVTPTNYSNYVTLALNDTTGSTIEGRVGGTLTGSFSVDSLVTINAVTSIPMVFKTANTERLRIASNGNIFVNNGNANANATLILSKSASGFAKLEFDEVTSQKAYIELDASEDLVHFGAAGVNQKFYAGNGERAKMTADGYSKFTSDGTYDGYANAQQAHEFRQSLNKPTLWCSNSSSAQTWEIIRAESARAASTAFHFFTCTSGNLSDDEFRVRGDGKVYGDNSYTIGADYAEYFEWSDGNTSNQDRRGMTVVLDGNKVKLSTSSDSADNIIGVVSGSPSVVGDSSWSAWSQKYLKDDYNQYILDSDGYRQLNSSYDDTKTYVPREDRQEWDAIGMVGKLRIRKGQTTGTRWIKMRDISDTVEEWLVR